MVTDLTAQASLIALPAEALRHVDDWPWLNLQSERQRSLILDRLAACLAVAHAPRGHGRRVAQALALRLRVSYATVHRWLGAWRKGGIKALGDGRSAGPTKLPAKFISHVRGLFDPHQRADDAAEVHRKLLADLARWEASRHPDHAIPGYQHPPRRDPATGLPHGWSYETILRRCKPRGYVAAATKQGPKAASAFLPPVLTTRVGSRVLSRVLFDDQDLDNLLADGQLAIAGIKDTQRPVSFNSLDFYTAAHLDHHLRALYRDPDTGRSKTLTSQEFTWFVIAHLQRKGYRTDQLGTELIFEHGTANPWQNARFTTLGGKHGFDEALAAVLAGHVRVNRSGKFNTPLFADLYFRPQSSGNFRFKTWIESSFRLLRTWMQALPGPTGSSSRQNRPGELHGIIQRERQLLAAMAEHLDPHHASLLRHHLLSFQQFHQLICAVYHAVNRRTEHDLEGWSQCGFTFPIWRPRLPEPGQREEWFSWAELDSLDPEARQLMLARINSNRAHLTREQRLSPDAAFQLELERDRAHIRFLPDALVGLLLPLEWSVEREIGRDHTFTLQNPLWPDTRDTYVGKIEEAGKTWLLDAGQKIRVFHNPFSDGRAIVHHPDGRYLGTIHPVVRARPFEPEAYLSQLGTRATIKSGHDSEIRARMADIAADRTARETHNDRLLAGQPATPEELAAARSAAGRQAHRTAAASRLHAHGTPVDWDAAQTPAQAPSGWDALPEDDPIPDAF